MDVNTAHVHLLLNHFPTIGTILGFGLLLLAYVRNNDHMKQVSLEVFFVIALITLPTYLSGNVAQQAIQDDPTVSKERIAVHQDAAALASVFMGLTGILAWCGLWQLRRSARPPAATVAAVLLLSVVTIALMTRAANIGGEIHHAEIRPAGEATAQASAGLASWVASFVIGSPWVWPASETFHFIGMCFLFSVILLVNLRMLGIMKNVSFAALHRLLPWAIFGLVINTITGMMFFIAAPDQYTQNPAFYWKVLFIFLAGGNILYLTAFDEAWGVGPGQDAPTRAKIIAASSIFVWFGVVFWGRLMPFLGLTF
jgi:uncharacterized membrane protein